MAMSREWYIRKGARKVTPKNVGCVFYLYERDGLFLAQCFIGRAQKPSWHYRFSTAAKREAKIAEQIKSLAALDKYKAERKAEASKPHKWEVGLILCGSWGYDQTNVDFFEVVKVIGKNMVEVEQIGCQTATDATDGFMSTAVVPDPEARTGKITRHKVSFGSINSPVYGKASPWDGRKKYCSWYA